MAWLAYACAKHSMTCFELAGTFTIASVECVRTTEKTLREKESSPEGLRLPACPMRRRPTSGPPKLLRNTDMSTVVQGHQPRGNVVSAHSRLQQSGRPHSKNSDTSHGVPRGGSICLRLGRCPLSRPSTQPPAGARHSDSHAWRAAAAPAYVGFWLCRGMVLVYARLHK
jgi:hypothetical protein